jgi:hypothetical protein
MPLYEMWDGLGATRWLLEPVANVSKLLLALPAGEAHCQRIISALGYMVSPRDSVCVRGRCSLAWPPADAPEEPMLHRSLAESGERQRKADRLTAGQGSWSLLATDGGALAQACAGGESQSSPVWRSPPCLPQVLAGHAFPALLARRAIRWLPRRRKRGHVWRWPAHPGAGGNGGCGGRSMGMADPQADEGCCIRPPSDRPRRRGGRKPKGKMVEAKRPWHRDHVHEGRA